MFGTITSALVLAEATTLGADFNVLVLISIGMGVLAFGFRQIRSFFRR